MDRHRRDAAQLDLTNEQGEIGGVSAAKYFEKIEFTV
jgi:hypothetical protein